MESDNKLRVKMPIGLPTVATERSKSSFVIFFFVTRLRWIRKIRVLSLVGILCVQLTLSFRLTSPYL